MRLHWYTCNGFQDCFALGWVYVSPRISQKMFSWGNTYHFIGVTQIMSSGLVCVCMPGVSRCPPKYLQYLSRIKQHAETSYLNYFSLTTHLSFSLSPLLSLSLTVLHWIINIIDTCRMTQSLVGVRSIAPVLQTCSFDWDGSELVRPFRTRMYLCD